MRVWKFLKQKMQSGIPVLLLYVLESKGSSPGRQGFRMAASADGDFCGSIGGGIMEQKLVEKARDMLSKKERKYFIVKQIHSKESPVNQSGMICSGEQTLALYPIGERSEKELNKLIETLEKGGDGQLLINSTGIFFKEEKQKKRFVFNYKNETDWSFSENIGRNNVVHIFGGGHVGLAMSRMMAMLGFYVKIYDDRTHLNTLAQNNFANEKIILSYEDTADFLEENEREFVVIMTFGYRSDKLILKQLYKKKFFYIGMMGSEAKIRQLYDELENEGIRREEFHNLHAPIGVPIFSKTPEEIAVSAAAEIIRVKNEGLPSGRSSSVK